MKVEIECAACLLHRGHMEILEATSDPMLQFKAMTSLIHLLDEEFKPTAVAADLGTKRERLIKRITGNPDPYARKKLLSNNRALEILPKVKRSIDEESSVEGRFRRACLCAIAGNVMEFDIPEHLFNLEDVERLIHEAEAELAVDEIDEIFDMARRACKILYLTDNAGEIAFDTLLVNELKRLGAHVTVAVKSTPVINDATLLDAEAVGMHRVADELITNGSDTVGLNMTECSKHFLALYKSADLVVAKGMGYAETLTELELATPHAMLLHTKCQPVANYFHTSTGKNVAKLTP